MPFERASYSFPGSAFYYLADTPRPGYNTTIEPSFDGAESSAGLTELADRLTGFGVGPAARAFRLTGMGADKARALQCLTMAVHYEAASESTSGQRAVAQVVLNRVTHPSYPGSVCGVVFQGSERRTGCQFSFTCDGSLARRPGRGSWARAQTVAQRALGGGVAPEVGLATHYHTTAINPYWASSLDSIGIIGAHIFYRWRGSAGRAAAFRGAYRGNEPMAGPRPHSMASDSAADAADPVALARAYEDARRKAQAAASAATAGAPAQARTQTPAYIRAVTQIGGDAQFTARSLPDPGGIKPEYAGSGRWLKEPGAPAR